GFVTAAELRQKLKFQLQRARTLGGPLPPPVPGGPDDPDQRIAQEIARLMAADTDRDGRISWAEAAAFVRSPTHPARLFSTPAARDCARERFSARGCRAGPASRSPMSRPPPKPCFARSTPITTALFRRRSGTAGSGARPRTRRGSSRRSSAGGDFSAPAC